MAMYMIKAPLDDKMVFGTMHIFELPDRCTFIVELGSRTFKRSCLSDIFADMLAEGYTDLYCLSAVEKAIVTGR